jgi:mannonate dehydratase
VVESVPVHEAIKLGTPDRDEYIEAFATTIRRLGQAGISTVCYNFMPVFDWMRTDFEHRLPDRSLTVAYSQRDLDALDLSKGLPRLPAWPAGYSAAELQELISRYEGVDDATFADRFCYFIQAVAPAAEEAGVRLAIHPDDPPWSIFGLPRVVNDEASLARILACSPSPAHTLTFCTGSLGARAGNDLPAMIRRFGDRIGFVHARNVKRTGAFDFHEVDHTQPAGDVDLVEVMQALVDSGFHGPLRPDHGRTIWGETCIVGYGLYDRALGLMYLQGILDALLRNS